MTTPSMQQPPLLPEETLVRVLRIARFDGIGAPTGAVRVAERKNVPLTAVCTSGWVKNVASWIVTTTGRPARSGSV